MGILVSHGRELVGTALVAGDSFPCAAVLRHLVVVVGGPELGCQFEGEEVEVPVGREIRVFPVELLVFIDEIGLDADLRLGETERLSPVIALKHHLHQCLEEESHLPFELPVGSEGCRAAVPDLPLVDTRLVFPEGRDPRRKLHGRKHELSATGDHHLGHLIDKHLHVLPDLVVGHAIEERGDEGEEVIVPLPPGKVGLGAAKGLDSVEDGDLRPLCWTCHRCFRPVPIRHQPVVEEVPEVPVLAERPGAEILQVMDMDVPGKVVVGEVGRQLEEVLLLADLVGLLLV